MALPSSDTKGWGAVVLTITTTRQAVAIDAHTRVQVLKNTHATEKIYLGGVDITTGNALTDGYPLAAGEVLTMSSAEGGEPLQVPLYAVTASGTSTLAVLRGNV